MAARVTRREFLERTTVGRSRPRPALVAGARPRRASAAASPYPDWIAASTKPAKRGGTLTRASAWDPPVIDPRLTQSVGTFQFVGLTSNRLVRYGFSDEVTSVTDLGLKGDLAESWTASPDHRVWTFKLRQGVKWHNLPPVNGREFVAADVKYCFEQYAKEGVQSFTFQEIEAIETPDKYTVRVHLKTPNVFFPQNLAEPVAVMFPREVLEQDGDLKKRLIGTGPYILKEHTRKVRVVLQRNPDYCDKGRPYVDEYIILSTPDAATRLAAFRTGQADFIWVASPSEVEMLRKTNPNAVVQAFHNTLAPFGVALAQDRPPFNDVRVRRAICDGHRPPEDGGHGVRGPRHPRLGRAVHLLPGHAAHGEGLRPVVAVQARRGQEAPGRGRSRQGLRDDAVLLRVLPADDLQVQLVQQDLKKNLNIDVKITKLDYTTYYGRYVESKWDGMSWGFQSGHAIGVDERTYQYMHSKSTEELLPRQRPGHRRADHQAAADARPRRAARDRQEDRRSRVRPGAAACGCRTTTASSSSSRTCATRRRRRLRRTDGYGSPTLARTWLDK